MAGCRRSWAKKVRFVRHGYPGPHFLGTYSLDLSAASQPESKEADALAGKREMANQIASYVEPPAGPYSEPYEVRVRTHVP
eukprot:SAG25_NODE_1706_length_2507_cov_2.964286_2_plen_81_part_00